MISCLIHLKEIIIERHNKEFKCISSPHPAYMALQYLLLFPYGERGFQIGVLYSGMYQAEPNTRSRMTMQDYFCYQFHYRKHQPNPFLCYGLLSSQPR
jgi:hypothetical protein